MPRARASCFTRPAYQIAENEAYMKVPDIKMNVYRIVCYSVKYHGHTFGPSSSRERDSKGGAPFSADLPECASQALRRASSRASSTLSTCLSLWLSYCQFSRANSTTTSSPRTSFGASPACRPLRGRPS